MKNTRIIPLFFQLCCLGLLTNSPAIAELSDQEKREFIESLAKPLKEKRVFYRWQSEESRKTLIQAGKMTSKLYRHYMGLTEGVSAGPGLYVSESMTSSTFFGPVLLQVELEPGHKFLDLTDPKIIDQLSKQNIRDVDVYDLNPRVAVKFTEDHYTDWWVLKEKKGVKFKPFSSKELDFKTLEEAYVLMKDGKPFFTSAIKKDVLNRAEKSSEVFTSPLIEIVEKEKGRPYVQKAINRHRTTLTNTDKLDEINGWLKYARQYLSRDDIKNLISKSKSFPIHSIDHGMTLLESMADSHTADKDSRMEIIKKTPVRTIAEGNLFLQKVGHILSKKEKKTIVNRVKALPVQHMEEIIDFLKKNSFLSARDKKEIAAKIIGKVEETVTQFKSVQGVIDTLDQVGEYMKPSDVKRLLRISMPFIHNFVTVERFSEFPGVEISDLKRMIKKIIPHINEMIEVKLILIRGKKYLDISDIKQVLKKGIPLIENVQDAEFILTLTGEYMESSDKKQIANKVLQFDGEKGLERLKKHLTDKEYNEILAEFESKTGSSKDDKLKKRLDCLKNWLH